MACSQLTGPGSFARHEGFSLCQYCLCVLRVKRTLNTEVTEMLRVLRVKA
jgi:hypothetical protein